MGRRAQGAGGAGPGGEAAVAAGRGEGLILTATLESAACGSHRERGTGWDTPRPARFLQAGAVLS